MIKGDRFLQQLICMATVSQFGLMGQMCGLCLAADERRCKNGCKIGCKKYALYSELYPANRKHSHNIHKLTLLIFDILRSHYIEKTLSEQHFWNNRLMLFVLEHSMKPVCSL